MKIVTIYQAKEARYKTGYGTRAQHIRERPSPGKRAPAASCGLCRGRQRRDLSWDTGKGGNETRLALRGHFLFSPKSNYSDMSIVGLTDLRVKTESGQGAGCPRGPTLMAGGPSRVALTSRTHREPPSPWGCVTLLWPQRLGRWNLCQMKLC